MSCKPYRLSNAAACRLQNKFEQLELAITFTMSTPIARLLSDLSATMRCVLSVQAGKPDEQQQPADLASAGLAIPSSQTDRAPLVTRHVPNKQVPADQLAISLPTQVAAQTSQVVCFCSTLDIAQPACVQIMAALTMSL